MSGRVTVTPAPVVVAVGLYVEAHAPNLTRAEAIRRWTQLGNPLLDTDGDRLIAVAQVERLPAADGVLVWACDHCGHYDETRAAVEAHERTCEGRP